MGKDISKWAEEISSLGAENERLTKLSDRSAQILREIGVIRMFQPVEHGGEEAHPVEFAETVMDIASRDASTGWVAGIVGVHPFEIAYMDPQAQEEVWGKDVDTWTASPYAPMGIARPVEGGYILNGRWSFSSGTDHASWLHIGAMVGGEDGKPTMPPSSMHVLVPRSDYEIVEDSWDVVGLSGTGSRDVTVTDAFIPTHRTIDYADVIDGLAPKRMGRSTTYQVPYTMAFPLGITAAVIGAAEGVRRCYLEGQQKRVLVTGAKAVDDPYALYAYSDAAAEIHAARAALLDNANRMYDLAAQGHEFTFDERAIGRRIQVAAAWRAVRAVDEIVARAGGYAMRKDNPLQRFWRDTHMGLVHAVHVPGPLFHAAALADMQQPQSPNMMRSMI